MTQQDAVRDGVSERADTDLQGSTVLDQSARKQADHVIGGAHRHVGWGRKCELVVGVLHHEVEHGRLDHGIVLHKGQLVVDLGDDGDRLALALAFPQ